MISRHALIFQLAVLVVMAGGPGKAQTEFPPDRNAASRSLPLNIENGNFTALTEARDAKLQARLSKAVASRPTWQTLRETGVLNIAVVDLSDPQSPRLATINGSKTVYAASLPKIAILLAAFQHIEDGKLVLNDAVDMDLNAMIRRSSNGAATRMIDRVGGLPAVNAAVARHGFYDVQTGGGLWVGKRFAKTGERIVDPVGGVSHAASATQVADFYYQLALGQLISPERSRQMLDVLIDPGIAHKFVAAMNQMAPEAAMYRKSGTWRDYHADSAIVWGEERRYILVGLVQSARGGAILQELAREVDGWVNSPDTVR